MRPLAAAEILAVGTELLTPFRIDTNSLYLTAQLNALGIDVRRKGIVGDSVPDLTDAIRGALSRADLVMLCGGLGPTEDDVTREAASAALGVALRERQELVEALRARFAKRAPGGVMPENNRRQAMVPDGAVVFANAKGSAPGLWIAHGEQVVVLLPGPPRELEPMFDVHVRPALAARSGGRTVERRILRIAGMPESRVDELAAPIYLPWLTAPVPIETTILASPGIVELQLSARGSDRAGMTAALDAAAAALANAVGDSVFTQTGAALEVVVGEALRARGATVALAESCTGGLASARLTDVPGSSAYVRGGVVAYSNDVKIEQLGVDAALIAAHGAVSEPVAAAMAAGVRRVLAADIGVGVTGIAGPDGGTPDKPVGTVWFAVDGPGHHRTTHVRVLPGDRHVIRQWAVVVLLDLVRRALRDSQ